MFKTLCIVLLAGFSVLPAQAHHIHSSQKYFDSSLEKTVPHEPRFSETLIQSGEFVRIKKAEWEACHRNSLRPLPFAGAHDPIQLFIEAPVDFKTLAQMESNNFKEGKLESNPWSGDYWSYSRGLLGARFLDLNFEARFDWLARYQYVQNNPASRLIIEKGQEAVNILSPSEKYDLLTGNSDGGFTYSQWQQGKAYYDDKGEVEGWMGICHGWAPASIAEPRPTHSVDVSSFDQKWKLHFNPSEIKGLLSYSWATNSFPVVTLGERCNDPNPKRDHNGRIIAPECFDLNPATWHLAVVHRIGVQKRSFIMDATYDYEVWNQPVVGYTYSYFNPITKVPSENLAEATVAKSAFKKDPFAKYRSAQSTSMVGIEMRVGYVVENGSSAEESDSPENDLVRWVSYTYDLELDANGQIIGGEWYGSNHPDFIWTPRKGVKPLSSVERGMARLPWPHGESIPAPWAEAAQMGSRDGVLLNVISEGLLNLSTAQ